MKSADKVMDTVFWDARQIIYTSNLKNGKTIIGQYYTSLLYQVSEEMKNKRPLTGPMQ